LTQYYNKDNSDKGESISLGGFVSDISDYIINIHPTASVKFELDGDPEIRVTSDLSVKHALINIIENGIKAANSSVQVKYSMTDDDPRLLEISIVDDGPGIPAEVMENMGEPFISMRKESMGLGIFLANAAIHKLGGSIEMFNMKKGGAKTIIKLPLPKREES
jgi:two-component system sensor histidine kinase RegB